MAIADNGYGGEEKRKTPHRVKLELKDWIKIIVSIVVIIASSTWAWFMIVSSTNANAKEIKESKEAIVLNNDEDDKRDVMIGEMKGDIKYIKKNQY